MYHFDCLICFFLETTLIYQKSIELSKQKKNTVFGKRARFSYYFSKMESTFLIILAASVCLPRRSRPVINQRCGASYIRSLMDDPGLASTTQPLAALYQLIALTLLIIFEYLILFTSMGIGHFYISLPDEQLE